MRLITNPEIFMVAGGESLVSRAEDGDAMYGSIDLSQVNGCTGVPDSPFGFEYAPSCNNHDMNYSDTTTMSRAEADAQFRTDMLNTCDTKYDGSLLCKVTANVYYVGVRILGGFFYEGP